MACFTKNINQIEQLNKLVERLYAKDPTQGASGAVFAMKEILTGQTQSIKDRFNMNGISADTITKLTNKGDINGTIKYLDQVFNKFGATQGIVTANFNSLTTQSSMFATNFKAAMGDEATPAVRNLATTLGMLNNQMQSGKFQPFFALIANGTAAAASGIGWLAQNINTVAPTIAGVIGAAAAYKVAMSAVAFTTEVSSLVISTATGNWIGLAAAIAGAAGAGLLATKLLSTANVGADSNMKSASDWAASYKSAQAAAGRVGNASVKVPVEISNKAPISVKGTVEIEKESQKYMFDIAAQRAMAQLNVQYVTPQLNVHVDNVNKTADLEEINQALGSMISQNSGTQAQGVY